MKQLLFFSLAFFLITTEACTDSDSNNENDDFPEKGTNKRISSIIEIESDGRIDTTFYKYDESGKIAEIRQESNDTHYKTTKTTFEYKKNEIYCEYWDYHTTIPDTAIYKLNKDGLIESMRYAYPQENGQTGFFTTYSYSEGKLQTINGNEVQWENGNIIKIAGNEYSYIYKYTTSSDLSGFLSGDWDELDDINLFMSGYFGKRNQHLVSESSYRNIYERYEYTLDKDGYVTEIKDFTKYDADDTYAFSQTTYIFYEQTSKQ